MVTEYEDAAPNVAGWTPTLPPPPAPVPDYPDTAPNVAGWMPQLPQYVPEPTYDAPDTAPNVTSWRSVAQGYSPDPYSTEALSTPAMPPPQSYYQGAATLGQTASAVGRAAYNTGQALGFIGPEWTQGEIDAIYGRGTEADRAALQSRLQEQAFNAVLGVVGNGPHLPGGGAADDLEAVIARLTRKGLTPAEMMRDPEFLALQAKSGFMPDYNAVPKDAVNASDITVNLRRAREQDAQAAREAYAAQNAGGLRDAGVTNAQRDLATVRDAFTNFDQVADRGFVKLSLNDPRFDAPITQDFDRVELMMKEHQLASQVAKSAPETIQQRARRLMNDESGSLRLGGDNTPTVPYEPAASASGRLFGVRQPTQELSRFDAVLNQLKETIGHGVPENAIATPIMRERRRVMAAVESQSARMGTIADDVLREFPTDRAGRIQNIPGTPTIQDLAARLPEFESVLTPAQRAAIERLRAETQPFQLSLAENGVTVRNRADVQDGGFYLPRGRADIEGADVPIKVGTGRGGAGGKKGFERGAVFDSMAQGIDAGYQYAPFRDALQSYAKDAGTRAIDSWAANEFKATGLGETASARLLRQNPELAQKKATLNSALSRFRSLADNLTNEQQAQIERFLHDPNSFAPDEIRDMIDVVNSRGTVTPLQARTALADTRAAIADIAPQWRRAMERAQQTPRDQGSIGFAGLNGSTFPDEIANVANKYLNADKPLTGRGAGVVNTTEAFNNLVRMLRSTLDVSYMGLQGLLGAASHPVAYSKALVIATRSLKDERALGAFVRNFDETALREGRPDSRAWAASGLRFGGTATEFTGGTGIVGRIPNAIGNAPGITQTNRAFGTFGDALRLATADGLFKARATRQLPPQEMADIAKFSNLMTGWSENRFGGDLGSIVQFAPRFFQSQLDLLGNALTNRGTVGNEAVKSLGALIGLGTVLTVAANDARGKQTDFMPGSNNFMRIRDVGGTDVSLFGQWDSLVRGLIAAGKGDFGYLARSKASPVVSLAWDQISGKSFLGEDTHNIDYILRQFLPFGLSSIGKENPVASAIGVTGVKATPMTRTEQVEAGRYSQLEGPDQLKAVRAASYKSVRDHAPADLQAELAGYNSMFEYKQAKQAEAYKTELGKVTEDYPQGQPENVARQRAESIANGSPANKAYLKAQTAFENEWIAKNPKLAIELDKQGQDAPASDFAWTMTIPQRIIAYRALGLAAAATPTPVGAR